MALDRQTIQRKDFPIGRRGYDPQAVDAHLSAIAAEIEQLRSSTQARRDSLAGAASEQVRAIVEAAEATAAEVRRAAEQQARTIRTEASAEVKSARAQSSSQASEYLAKVSAATSAMLDRLGAIEQELAAMAENLRTGATRVGSELKLLEANLAEVKDAGSPGEELGAAPAAPRAAPVAPRVAPAAARAPEPEEAYEDAAPAAEAPGAEAPARAAEAPAAEPEPQAKGPGAQAGDDVENARLIALNMALNGTPRDEVDRYLEESFDLSLSDRAALIQEVYASVEG